MSATDEQTTYSAKLEHTFRAPRERVFAAWTDPEQIPLWFGAPDSQMIKAEVDLRPGGEFRFHFDPAQAADGCEASLVHGVFKEVVTPEKLVYTWNVEPWPPPAIRDSLVTVEFRERGEWTDVVLRHEALPSESARSDHAQGWQKCCESLENYLQ